MSATAAGPSTPRFLQALGLRDVVFMTVVAVVGLRWIARGARAGPPALTLWLLAWLAFFVPLAAAVSELASREPAQGSLYVWTRRAFGPIHGFICAWCHWVNNLFYFPSLLLFAAANAPAVLGPVGVDLADDRRYTIGFVLVALWAVVGVSIAGFRTGRWVQNLGSLGVWLPAGLLIAAGAIVLATTGSATPIAPADLLPAGGDLLGTISLWSAMCFAFSGLEIGSLVGLEVRRPERTIPVGIALAGIAATLIYVLGSAALLAAVPPDALRERTGIVDAIELATARVGLERVGGLTGGLLAASALAGTLSWMAGAARVPFAAGVDRVMPAPLARLHPRYGTPYLALLVQGVLSSAIFLASVFLSTTGARPTVQEAYDVLVGLTILIYFVPYVYLFLALPKLRRLAGPAAPGEIRIPGGSLGLWLVAGGGFLATLVSLLLVFVPPPGTASLWSYELNIAAQSAAVIGCGLLLYLIAARRPAR
ncbi:MAG TPA: APC family permease [Vicinamibacterales bacterium]|nr:APC family permease [Vicinamibacterales bacterium]